MVKKSAALLIHTPLLMLHRSDSRRATAQPTAQKDISTSNPAWS
jgi:hypothetical protein